MKKSRLTKTTKARITAALLIGLSFIVTGWLDIRSASDQPPSASESANWWFWQGLLQIAAGSSVFRVGRADPSHARSSVRRLVRAARKSNEARKVAESARETISTNSQYRNAMGILSVHLSYIEEDTTLAIDDWMEFHGDALQDVVGEDHEHAGQETS